jgi:hypothetical protein
MPAGLDRANKGSMPGLGLRSHEDSIRRSGLWNLDYVAEGYDQASWNS